MSPDTRALLVAAAAKLLDRGGPAAVTLREVGKLAGVSHNAPYKHFADKEELLAAIASRELRRQSQAMSDLGATRRPIETMRLLMRGYVRWARAKPARFKLTFGPWTTENDDLGEAASESRATLVSIVKAAQARDELPLGNPDRIAALFLALAHGAADLALSGHLSAKGKGSADPEDLVDDLILYLRTPRPRKK
jgi:AcrR family transcriptional regulator